MNISGAMLITQKETIWLQEGLLSKIDVERHEVSGYFYYLANRKIEINSTSELYINGVRLHIKLVMKSIGFHPQILKYRFIAIGSVKDLMKKDELEVKLAENCRIIKTSESMIAYN
jgi:hypothetical protein